MKKYYWWLHAYDNREIGRITSVYFPLFSNRAEGEFDEAEIQALNLIFEAEYEKKKAPRDSDVTIFLAAMRKEIIEKMKKLLVKTT